MKKLILIGMLTALSGCIVNAPVPTGKNTFLISAHGSMYYHILPDAIAKANAFCAARGQVATVNETQTAFFDSEITVQFTCSSEESQGTSTLRPDRGISTNN